MSGSWQPLSHQPTFRAGTMLLLTDGSVFCHDSGSSNWWKLTPDQYGNYVNGTWASLSSGPNAPLYYASAVLRDGRVLIAGGEYNNGATAELLAAEIYDPMSNVWTVLPTPAGWTQIGDAPSCVLPDGRVFIGSINSNRTAIYDPVSNTWSTAANKNNSSSSEETWTLLPDETVITADCPGHPKTEKYIIAADRWVNIGPTPSDLVEAASIEIGPAILLPDGRLFAVGATNHTALYTMPPIASQPGTWVNGPTFPLQSAGEQLGAKDAPACLLPNGHVLCVAGPVNGVSGDYLSPTYFFEFDPISSTLTAVTNPPNNGGPPYAGRMLLLPTGQVLFANESSDVEVYTPDGMPDPVWRPSITAHPSSVQPHNTYTLYGRQINGLSQAGCYGDDAMMATNYPLVRIRNLITDRVFYCHTHAHSTMGIQTGTVIHSTQFTVPAGIDLGISELCVVANGISSDCVRILVNNKIWKELKWEVKELSENVKQIPDIKDRKGEVEGFKVYEEGDPLHRFDNYPEWLRIIRILAERSDKIEEERQKKNHFITEAERPKVGDDVIKKSESGKKPKKHRSKSW